LTEILQYDPQRRWAAAARVGDLLYLAGETGMDPATGEIVAGGVEAQTEQVITNIEATLAHFGADLGDVFKLTVYLTDIADLPVVGAVRARHFTTPLPSTAVQVVALASPDMRVEIEAIARVPAD
jgi:2-iminobutanoate/2-iminopropanoate deaminase